MTGSTGKSLKGAGFFHKTKLRNVNGMVPLTEQVMKHHQTGIRLSSYSF